VVPVHQGIPGNATADSLAKRSTMHSPVHPEVDSDIARIQMRYSEVCSLISHHCLQLLNEQYINTSRAITYKLFCPDIDTGQTKIPVTTVIFRLPTGHFTLHSHLHKIDLQAHGLCDTWDIQETVEHFLMQSGKYAEARYELQRSIRTTKIHPTPQY